VSNRELLRQRLKKGVREPRLKHNAGRQQRKLLKHNDERNSASKRRERRGELQERGGSKESKLKLRLQLKGHVNENAKRKGAVDVAAAAAVAQEEG
jgi:hypothetical protein